jgi:hypothetical protein
VKEKKGACTSEGPHFMFKFSLALAALALSAPLLAADPPPPAGDDQPTPMPDRMSSLIVYGNDPCPKSTSDEIVVCAREPESERYRLPKRFRGQKKALASQGSWANNVRQLETVSRQGLPDTCSPVGSGGATGCFQKFLRDSRAQKESDRQDALDNAP